jgi:hypothetical protein
VPTVHQQASLIRSAIRHFEKDRMMEERFLAAIGRSLQHWASANTSGGKPFSDPCLGGHTVPTSMITIRIGSSSAWRAGTTGTLGWFRRLFLLDPLPHLLEGQPTTELAVLIQLVAFHFALERLWLPFEELENIARSSRTSPMPYSGVSSYLSPLSV